jgi:GNAT superfamily N-acetyltransferase
MFRRAKTEEAEFLTSLTRRSKAYWGYDADFMRVVAVDLTVTPSAIKANEVWVLEQDGEILGFHQVKLGDPAWLEDLWLEPQVIGKGYGRQLWEHAVSIARSAGALGMEFNAEPFAMGFYERMGAVQVGETPSRFIPGRKLPLMRIPLDP